MPRNKSGSEQQQRTQRNKDKEKRHKVKRGNALVAYPQCQGNPFAVAVFLLQQTAQRSPHILIRYNITALTNAVAGFADTVMQFVILGAAEVLVKTADFCKNFPAVTAVKNGIHIFFFAAFPAVPCRRTAEHGAFRQ